MLKTQPPASETQTPPPTPQEIAQAIAAIEERKHSPASSQVVQTTTVSDIIDHLGLDMTPADILAEVNAQRARPKPLGSLPTALRKRVFGITAVGGLLICWGVWLSSEGTQEADTVPPPAAAAPVFYTPSPQHLAISPDTLVKDTTGHAPLLTTLGEVLDNHPVQCGFLPDGQTTINGTLWTLIKHGSKTYLRCWVVSMSPSALQQQSAQPQGIMLSLRRGNSNGGLPATVPLTLATNTVSVQPSDTWTEGYFLTSRSIHLDSHAHEPWNP